MQCMLLSMIKTQTDTRVVEPSEATYRLDLLLWYCYHLCSEFLTGVKLHTGDDILSRNYADNRHSSYHATDVSSSSQRSVYYRIIIPVYMYCSFVVITILRYIRPMISGTCPTIHISLQSLHNTDVVRVYTIYIIYTMVSVYRGTIGIQWYSHCRYCGKIGLHLKGWILKLERFQNIIILFRYIIVHIYIY